jgi:tripartite-type tricarboxylate transporter receptor subunit TctC
MKSLTRTLTSGLLGAIVLVAGLSSAPAMSQEDVADFYDDKTVTVVIRSTPGGGYDFYGRLIARHLGKHLPGNPEVIAVNRPGAGGLVATNYMYNRAPKDGTEILIPAREYALTDRLGARGVRYDTLEMPALGSVSQATRVWLAGPDVPVDNLEDLSNFREKTGRDFRFAVSGKGAGSYQMARLLQEGGYPVEIIVGYEGTSDQTLAVLRGEADGTINTYTSAIDTIEDEGFKVFTKLGTHPAVADVKSITEGLSGNEKQLAEVLGRLIKVGRPFVTAPGVPEERLAALREAFRKVVHDPEAQEEAKRAERSLEGYVSAEEMTEAYQRLFDAPDEVLELLRTDTE